MSTLPFPTTPPADTPPADPVPTAAPADAAPAGPPVESEFTATTTATDIPDEPPADEPGETEPDAAVEDQAAAPENPEESAMPTKKRRGRPPKSESNGAPRRRGRPPGSKNKQTAQTTRKKSARSIAKRVASEDRPAKRGRPPGRAGRPRNKLPAGAVRTGDGLFILNSSPRLRRMVENFRDTLQKELAKRGTSEKKFAKRLGVGEPRARQYIAGRALSMRTMSEIADAVGKDLQFRFV